MPVLFTAGYNAWTPQARVGGLTRALIDAGVSLLVDIRHSPCASDPTGKSRYGAKPWNLQVFGGIVEQLTAVKIRYQWLAELGNPQKNDPQLAVLQSHLADKSGGWPVHRGLALLAELIVHDTCCLLCGCAHYHKCHRKLIAEKFKASCGEQVTIVNLARTGQQVIE